MKLLIVGFSESIHVARWIDQLESFGWDVYLFPCVDNGVTNKEIRGVTVFHTFFGNSNANRSIRVKGLPVLSHLFAIALRLARKRFSPDYQQKRLAAIIRKIKPDVIHSMEMQHSAYLVYDVWKNWRGRFPKWIVTNWGSDIYLMGRLKEHSEKINQVLSACDYYSCECFRDINLGRKFGFTGEVLPVFPNSGGFNLKKLKKLRDKTRPSFRKVIVLKGYQGWAGRAQVALRALEKCGKLLDGYELVIYSIQPGSGVELPAQILCEKYNLKLTIVPLNSPHNEILSHHGRARISIGLSISDAISTMVLEAMVMGSFPIQSNTSCANEWIKSGETGYVVPPEDPEIISKSIKKALSDDKLVDNGAKRNWKVAQERLDEKIIKKKVKIFYERINMEEGKKVFVTGVFGSGKTTFAKKTAKANKVRFISFDKSFNYHHRENQSKKLLQNLPDDFVIDAIPIDEKDSWGDFVRYERKRNDVEIVCVYCPSMSVWLKRVGKRAIYHKGSVGTLKHWAKKALRKKILPVNLEQLNKDYRNFFTNVTGSLKKFKNVKCYDSCANEYTTIEEMLERVKVRTFEFQDYLQSLPKGYDKYYQDIEIIDFKGYSESYKTWNIIRKLVNWKGKSIVDLGCFQGYFSFKAEDEGAKSVLGLEKSKTVLETAKRINKLRGGKTKLKHWEGGEEIPKCDIILCLNVLHHFPDKDKVLGMMNCKKAIFEIYKKDRPIVTRHMKVIKTAKSQRSKRTILLCEPKKTKK